MRSTTRPLARRAHLAGMGGRIMIDRVDEIVVRFSVFDGTSEDWLWRRCPGERRGSPDAWYEQIRRIDGV
jgi:hypothetical protein